MRAIDVKHVGIAADGGSEEGFGTRDPFLLELGPMDASKAELGHDTGDNVLRQ